MTRFPKCIRLGLVLLAAQALGVVPAGASTIIRHLGPHTGGHTHSNGRAIASLHHQNALHVGAHRLTGGHGKRVAPQ